MEHRIHEMERTRIVRLLADEKAFGRAMAYLVAYVRRHADEANSTLEATR